MRPTLILIAALLIPFGLAAQISTLTADSLVKTSEYYLWTYSIAEQGGFSSNYWSLGNQYQLYFGSISDSPVANRKKLVGTWTVLQDSIMFSIPKPRKIWWYKMPPMKYRPFEISWRTADIGNTPSGESVSLTSVAIVLSADPKLRITEVLNKFKEYIAKDPRFILSPRDVTDSVSNHMLIEELVQRYFNEPNVCVGIKQYRNDHLWRRRNQRGTNE